MASISITHASVIKAKAAELRVKRLQEVISKLLNDIDESIAQFDGCIEVRYSHDYLNPPMTHDLVTLFRAAGYRAYYYDAGHYIHLIIAWEDAVDIPIRYTQEPLQPIQGAHSHPPFYLQ